MTNVLNSDKIDQVIACSIGIWCASGEIAELKSSSLPAPATQAPAAAAHISEEQKLGATFVFMGYLGFAYYTLKMLEGAPGLTMLAEALLLCVSLSGELIWEYELTKFRHVCFFKWCG